MIAIESFVFYSKAEGPSVSSLVKCNHREAKKKVGWHSSVHNGSVQGKALPRNEAEPNITQDLEVTDSITRKESAGKTERIASQTGTIRKTKKKEKEKVMTSK